jgi:hypothetical protein
METGCFDVPLNTIFLLQEFEDMRKIVSLWPHKTSGILAVNIFK